MLQMMIALIIIVPALEIGLLILSGNTLGIFPTIVLIILTGVLGAWLAKKQGMETLRNFQQQVSYGRPPGDAIIDGLCILVGGVVLLTPGFITDAIGFMLLIPLTRNILKPFLLKIIKRMIDRGSITIIR
ncbi:FxsA family protein [Cytobacillus sp. Hm23]|uniref:FxsA family protein n=1 Tax=Cytobacillus sp. IB215665 TaxID=3097357 RepID=UPI002A17E98A|nr:FxsA family protein [Cytobacillus sp. IB215665]MDX8363951.1 FxsA family protein [Cytobacillus sp. IB215665]